MIEVRDVIKKFDGFAALDTATLTVPKGSVYGLVGPNGAGKSTIIRHLTGIYRQDAGVVEMDGQAVWENAALKARVAAIPDDWYFFQQATIRDMMRFYLRADRCYACHRVRVLYQPEDPHRYGRGVPGRNGQVSAPPRHPGSV